MGICRKWDSISDDMQMISWRTLQANATSFESSTSGIPAFTKINAGNPRNKIKSSFQRSVKLSFDSKYEMQIKCSWAFRHGRNGNALR